MCKIKCYKIARKKKEKPSNKKHFWSMRNHKLEKKICHKVNDDILSSKKQFFLEFTLYYTNFLPNNYSLA